MHHYITDGDIRRGLEKKGNFLQLFAKDVMTNKPEIIMPNQLASYALHIMDRHVPKPITVLPVVNDKGKSIGMLHMTDLLRNGIL